MDGSLPDGRGFNHDSNVERCVGSVAGTMTSIPLYEPRFTRRKGTLLTASNRNGILAPTARTT